MSEKEERYPTHCKCGTELRGPVELEPDICYECQQKRGDTYFTVNIKKLEHFLFGMTDEERDKELDEWVEFYQKEKSEKKW